MRGDASDGPQKPSLSALSASGLQQRAKPADRCFPNRYFSIPPASTVTTMPTTPSSPPLRLYYARSERRRGGRGGATVAVSKLVSRVISAVNARGLCAAEVARIADLPKSEIAEMAAQCGCAGCWRARAN